MKSQHGSGLEAFEGTRQTLVSSARNAEILFMSLNLTTQRTLKTPLKTHGGKFYLSPFILGNFPKGYQDMDYCEVCGGGASVLLRKEPSRKEILNDLDYGTSVVWEAIQQNPRELMSDLNKLTYDEATFKKFQEDDNRHGFIPDAVREFALRRMSRGGHKKSFGWSKRLRGGRPGDLNAWHNAINSIPAISERIQNVEITHYDFRTIMTGFNRSDVVMYLDPPYLKSTRAKGCDNIYSVEMEARDHIDLIRLCMDSKAKIILSAYESQLYKELIGAWRKAKKAMPNHASQAATKKTKMEFLYMNF